MFPQVDSLISELQDRGGLLILWEDRRDRDGVPRGYNAIVVLDDVTGRRRAVAVDAGSVAPIGEPS